MNAVRTALVLGGSGFVGRHVCRALRLAGWRVVVVGRCGRSTPGCEVHTVGHGWNRVDDLVSLLTRFRPTAVVNSAGAVWAPSPEELDDSNVRLAEEVAVAAAQLRFRPRVVHLGSSFEYAPVPRGTSLDERAPTAPRTEYGRSKLRGTQRVLALARENLLSVVVLRVFNAIGPDMPPRSLPGRVAATLLRAREMGQRTEVSLPVRTQWRDFVDVRDVADAVARAAADPVVRYPDVVNIGRGVATGTDTLVRELVRVSGVTAKLHRPRTTDPGADGGLDWQCADIGSATRRWEWRPSRSLHRTLHDLWATEAQRTGGQPAATDPTSPLNGKQE